MGLTNYWSQKSYIDGLQSDLSGLTTYAHALNSCAADLNYYWAGNTDKQYIFSAISRQMQVVNSLRQEVNWVSRTSNFVLEKLNELGMLEGFSQPFVAQIAAIGMAASCSSQPRIRLDTSAIRTAATTLNTRRSSLTDSSGNLFKANSIIDLFILGIWGIGGRLNGINSQIDELIARHDRIIGAINQCATLYDQADFRLKQKAYALHSPGLVEATQPYAFLLPGMAELIKRYAGDIYENIKDWIVGREVKDGTKRVVKAESTIASSPGNQNNGLTNVRTDISFRKYDADVDFFEDRNWWDNFSANVIASVSDPFKGIRGEAGEKNAIKQSIKAILDGDYGVSFSDKDSMMVGHNAELAGIPFASTIISFYDWCDAMGDIGEQFKNGIAGKDVQKILMLYDMKAAVADSGNKALIKAIDELIDEYTKCFSAAFEAAQREWLKLVGEVGLDLASFGAFGVLTGIWEGIWDITGVTTKGDAFTELYATSKYMDSLLTQYHQYKLKIASGKYSPQDLESYKNLFELCKSTKIQQYTMLLTLTSDQNERKALESALKELKVLQLYDNTGGNGDSGGSGSTRSF